MSHVRLDDVNYDICVKEREDGRFTVAWVCLQCCEQGPPIPADESLERAVSFAHIGLRAHHSLVHDEVLHYPGLGELAELINNPVEEQGRTRKNGHAAYEHVRIAFDKLCATHAKLRSCNALNLRSANACHDFAAACRDWNEIAREFNAALETYSAEVSKFGNELEISWQPSPTRQNPAASSAPPSTNGRALSGPPKHSPEDSNL